MKILKTIQNAIRSLINRILNLFRRKPESQNNTGNNQTVCANANDFSKDVEYTDGEWTDVTGLTIYDFVTLSYDTEETWNSNIDIFGSYEDKNNSNNLECYEFCETPESPVAYDADTMCDSETPTDVSTNAQPVNEEFKDTKTESELYREFYNELCAKIKSSEKYEQLHELLGDNKFRELCACGGFETPGITTFNRNEFMFRDFDDLRNRAIKNETFDVDSAYWRTFPVMYYSILDLLPIYDIICDDNSDNFRLELNCSDDERIAYMAKLPRRYFSLCWEGTINMLETLCIKCEYVILDRMKPVMAG